MNNLGPYVSHFSNIIFVYLCIFICLFIYNTIANLVPYTKCTAEIFHCRGPISSLLHFFSLFPVKKVEYQTDWPEWSTNVNCCQGIIEKMDENFFNDLFSSILKHFYSVPHTTPRVSKSRYSWNESASTQQESAHSA